MVECTLHMHVSFCDCPEFRDEIPFKEGECKTRENSNFLKKGKIVILVKTQNFSRSRMTKRISPLASSREIYSPRRISSNSESRNFKFFEAPSVGCRKTGLRDL